MANEKNMEARIRYLTEELHKANMEINRLVLENQEQDFEIHRLKKLVNGLWIDFPVEEYDDSTDAFQKTLEKFNQGYAKGFCDKKGEEA